MRFQVLCRSCGEDTMVLVFRSTGQSRWMPEACPKCESDDLVALRDLSQAEQEEIERAVAERAPAAGLVWRWKTVADPNRPRTGPHKRRIPHPLAARVGEPVRELARGANGARLLEFADGFRVVAPYYSAGRPA